MSRKCCLNPLLMLLGLFLILLLLVYHRRRSLFGRDAWMKVGLWGRRFRRCSSLLLVILGLIVMRRCLILGFISLEVVWGFIFKATIIHLRISISFLLGRIWPWTTFMVRSSDMLWVFITFSHLRFYRKLQKDLMSFLSWHC